MRTIAKHLGALLTMLLGCACGYTPVADASAQQQSYVEAGTISRSAVGCSNTLILRPGDDRVHGFSSDCVGHFEADQALVDVVRNAMESEAAISWIELGDPVCQGCLWVDLGACGTPCGAHTLVRYPNDGEQTWTAMWHSLACDQPDQADLCQEFLDERPIEYVWEAWDTLEDSLPQIPATLECSTNCPF